jgi:mannose-6-phosphate isomerase-like protein (cupin superfamily)
VRHPLRSSNRSGGRRLTAGTNRRRGPWLHKHDYDEIVYVIAGRSRWTVGNEVREAGAGDVLVVRAGEPHKFVSIGEGTLRQIDIHLNPTFAQ